MAKPNDRRDRPGRLRAYSARLPRALMAAGWVIGLVFLTGCADWLGCLACWLPGGACTCGPAGPMVYVNIQVDAEQEDIQGIQNIVEELKRRGIQTTIYVTADYANRNALLVNGFYEDGFEIALHGYYTGEQLASMTYEEQKDLLSRAKTALEGCQPCGTGKPITGFRPQYFSQNEDTYRVLDELGLTYNSGYKARQLYTAGHEQDAAPYLVDGHGFYAVPISTLRYNEQDIYSCDIACANVNHLTGDQWGEVLAQGFQQARTNGEPFVILLHGWYTGDDGQYDYWQPLVDFLDAIRCDATFVTTTELVERFAD